MSLRRRETTTRRIRGGWGIGFCGILRAGKLTSMEFVAKVLSHDEDLEEKFVKEVGDQLDEEEYQVPGRLLLWNCKA